MARMLRAALSLACLLAAVTLVGCRSSEQDGWPAKPADFVSLDAPTSGDWKDTTVFSPGPAKLIGPHFGLRFALVGVSPVEEQHRYRAAAGHEFLIVLTDGAAAPNYKTVTDEGVVLDVLVDGKPRSLPALPLRGLVISVPKGHDATLRVSDDGRAQSLNLRTGERIDEIPGFYRNAKFTMTGPAYTANGAAGYKSLHAAVSVSLEPKEAWGYLEPWDGVGHWPKPGRAWLVVTGTELKTTTMALDQDVERVLATHDVTYAVDLSRSFEVTLPGATATPLPQPAHNTFDYQSGFIVTLLFDVPDSFTGGTLAFKPLGDFFAPTEKVFQPGSKTIPFTWHKPLTKSQPYKLAPA
jgi:hypothetical protein